MKIEPKDFRVPPGKKVQLKEWPTIIRPLFKSKKQYEKLLDEHACELARCNSFTMLPTVMRCW